VPSTHYAQVLINDTQTIEGEIESCPLEVFRVRNAAITGAPPSSMLL
jgi:hypothetical protein